MSREGGAATFASFGDKYNNIGKAGGSTNVSGNDGEYNDVNRYTVTKQQPCF
jgi:hypothetical protein